MNRLKKTRDIERSTTEKSPSDFTIRAMTYNIHSCLNLDGNILPKRVANVIRQSEPDVVALQEVDAGMPRTHSQDQAKLLGEILEMDYVFFPVVSSGPQKYGLAVLSRLSFQGVNYDWLPGLYPKLNLNLQRRGVIQAILKTKAGPIHFFNTHLSLFKAERRKQLQALLGEKWLSAIPQNEPVIFCGDLNSGPFSSLYHKLTDHLKDVQKAVKNPQPPKSTYHPRLPLFRIDHIFVSKHFRILKVDVPINKESKVASDHLPLYADLELETAKLPH
jgi:endonuclease/exonuclease/phosphatase family metal-dependent hydrolase